MTVYVFRVVISWAERKEEQEQAISRQYTLASISYLEAAVRTHPSWLATDHPKDSIPGKFEFQAVS